MKTLKLNKHLKVKVQKRLAKRKKMFALSHTLILVIDGKPRTQETWEILAKANKPQLYS